MLSTNNAVAIAAINVAAIVAITTIATESIVAIDVIATISIVAIIVTKLIYNYIDSSYSNYSN